MRLDEVGRTRMRAVATQRSAATTLNRVCCIFPVTLFTGLCCSLRYSQTVGVQGSVLKGGSCAESGTELWLGSLCQQLLRAVLAKEGHASLLGLAWQYYEIT